MEEEHVAFNYILHFTSHEGVKISHGKPRENSKQCSPFLDLYCA